VGDAELDRKIALEAEKRKEENAAMMDLRLKKKQELAKITRQL